MTLSALGLLAVVVAAASPHRRFTSPPLHLAAAFQDTTRAPLTILFAGDVNFARSLAREYIHAGRGAEIFAQVQDRVRAADLAVLNLESLILDRDTATDPTNSPTFAGPVEALPLLLDAGFDAVSTANNHAWDFGLRGVTENLAHLDSAGVPRTGTGATRDEAWQPVMLRARGWTVAVFGLTWIINHPTLTVYRTPAECCIAWVDTLEAARRFAAARAAGADLVIAYVHQGWVEYTAYPDLDVVRQFRGLVHAGADAVIGHHPHVPQGWEVVDGKPVVYSLGNFVFRQLRPWTNRGLAAELTWAPSGRWRLDLLPVAAGYTPSWLGGPDSAAVLTHVDSISTRIGLPRPRLRRNVSRPSNPRN